MQACISMIIYYGVFLGAGLGCFFAFLGYGISVVIDLYKKIIGR